MNKLTLFLLLSMLSTTISLSAQIPKPVSSADILSKMEKLNTIGSVLYVAAHPDDENTRLISYISNIKDVKTTYLSLTRGDGGQNMVGTHIQEDLGIIRTQELLAARRIDNGNQMFTRANDFGYSKTSKESLEFWGEDEVLADVVWAIRKTRPDVIINRFSADDTRTHGHHRASAILAIKAFELAGDPNAFPDQLQHVEPWQPKKIFYNTSWWRYGSKEAFEKVDKSDMVTVDIGAYDVLFGESMSEIAARSRSQHKSQGFGSSGTRGTQNEYLQLIKDVNIQQDTSAVIDMSTYEEKISITRIIPENYSLFSGIDMSWNRLEKGQQIDFLTTQMIEKYNPAHPDKSITTLLKIRSLIEDISDNYWREIKLAQIDDIIVNCLGLYVTAFTDKIYFNNDDTISYTVEVTNRSEYPVKIIGRKSSIGTEIQNLTINLENNTPVTFTHHESTSDLSISVPYWLEKPGTLGLYKVSDQELVGKPENDPVGTYTVMLDIGGSTIEIEAPIVEQHTERVGGEIRNPIAIVPKIVVLPSEDFYLFKNGEKETIEIRIRSYADNVKDNIQLQLIDADGWIISEQSQAVTIDQSGGEATVQFVIDPPKTTSDISAILTNGKGEPLQTLTSISYDHIPLQTKVKQTNLRLVNVAVDTKGEKIGYIMGPGDKVPQAIEQLGYQVDLLGDADIKFTNLEKYDAIVTGIRAYNTVDRMKIYQPILFKYVENGGVLIVQYNTTWGLDMDNVGPYPITFSRLRVTEEDAHVDIIGYDHPIMTFPNEITSKDFENWVQERGLYFASEWDDRYSPILSASDNGEEKRQGGMLVTNYGKGYYIYSGYSWFRELPAGVPGAFRIFANMLSLGHAE